MVQVRVFGKKDCGMCEKAKDKLERLGIEYEFVDAEKLLEPHSGWGAFERDLRAAYEYYYPMPLPLIQFGNGQFLNYTEAMREAKEYRAKRKSQRVAQVHPTLAVAG